LSAFGHSGNHLLTVFLESVDIAGGENAGDISSHRIIG
jgi:hypothetical protein